MIEQIQDRKKHKKKYSNSPEHKKKKKRSNSGDSRKKEKKHKRSRSRQKERDRQKQYDREKQRNKRKERQRSYSPQKNKYNSHDASKERQRNNYYNRDQDRGKRNYNDKYDKYDKYNNYDKYDKYDRGGNRRRNKEYYKNDYRFDSPPKSDESDMSEDPQKMNKLNQMKAAKQLVTSKADRKLYLGNLPPNITSNQLMQMLNSALKKMDINTQAQGDSIVSAWISPDGVGHYAFVQFRTAQEATNGLTLNGASLFGYQLKLGRPKQYIEYNKQLLSEIGTDGNMDGILKKVAAMGPDLPEVQARIVTPPSKVIILKHILTIEQLAIDQQYEEIVEDILEMGKRYGEVVNIVVPRPHQIINIEEAPKRVKGLGYAFLQYKTVNDAVIARRNLITKMFSDRSVACSYFDQQRFRQAEYDVQDKIIIDF